MESHQVSSGTPPVYSHTSATSNPDPFTIAIVGAGIGGLSLALGLIRHNVDVRIYEAASNFTEFGAGITLAPNLQRAASLITPELGAALEKISSPTAGYEDLRTWMTLRLGMDVKHSMEKGQDDTGMQRKAGEFLADFRTRELGWGKYQVTVHRSKYLDEMVKLLPEGFTTFHKALVDIKDGPDGKGVVLEFADGTTATASAVIGCDGIRSRTRSAVLGKEVDLQFTGMYVYRALVPIEKANEIVGEERAREYIQNVGYDGFVLTYPIDNFSVLNVVAGRIKTDGKWEHEKWTRSVSKEALLHDYKGWGDHVMKLLELVEKPNQWALYDIPSASTFFRGKICLLGDAAHASTPYQGSGGGMAVEDAYILSNLIGAIERAEDLETAFKAYDEVRRPRTQRQVRTSRALGHIFMLRGEGIGDDLRKVPENVVDRHDWIWYHDLEEDLKHAKEMLASETMN